MSRDDTAVTWSELRAVLRHLERKTHPRAAGAATLGSLRDAEVEASRTIVWIDVQNADGTLAYDYEEYE